MEIAKGEVEHPSAEYVAITLVSAARLTSIPCIAISSLKEELSGLLGDGSLRTATPQPTLEYGRSFFIY
jgi:hypothetical protein